MKQPGFALLLVLLVVAAVELLTLSTLALATHEAVSIGATERAIAGSRAAESALRRAIRDWPVAGSDSLLVSQSVTHTDSNGTVLTIRRSTAGLFEVTASAPAGRTRVHEVALVKTLDLERGIAEANQAIVARGIVTAPNAQFLADPSTCSLPPTLLGSDTLHLSDSTYAFAGLSWSELASIADTGLVYVNGSHTLPAGAHSGITAVNGSVTLQSGVDLVGVLVARGNVLIEDGVHITGVVIARGRASVMVGAADLTFSRCAVARALQQTPAARRLARSSRRFIPAF